MAPNVGQDIEAVCGRCGDTWHVVMAKVGDKVAKVVCKRCGTAHSYRIASTDGPGAAAPAAGAGRRPFTLRRKPKRGARTLAPAPVFDPALPPRPYSVRESYGVGQRIVHPSFGTGVVATLPGPGKVEVEFPGGNMRVLASAKATSTLERPVAVSGAPIGDRPPDKV